MTRRVDLSFGYLYWGVLKLGGISVAFPFGLGLISCRFSHGLWGGFGGGRDVLISCYEAKFR